MPFSLNCHVVPTMWFLENQNSKPLKQQTWIDFRSDRGLTACGRTAVSQMLLRLSIAGRGEGENGKIDYAMWASACGTRSLSLLGLFAARLAWLLPAWTEPQGQHCNTSIHKLSNGALTNHLNDEGSLSGFDWFCQGHSYKYCSERHMVKDLSVLWPCLHQMSKRQDFLCVKYPFRHSNSNESFNLVKSHVTDEPMTYLCFQWWGAMHSIRASLYYVALDPDTYPVEGLNNH